MVFFSRLRHQTIIDYVYAAHQQSGYITNHLHFMIYSIASENGEIFMPSAHIFPSTTFFAEGKKGKGMVRNGGRGRGGVG